MIGSLFIGATADAVESALAGVEGEVAVLASPRLARALDERGRAVIAVTPELRSLRRARVRGVYAGAGALPFADASLGAVVGLGAGTSDDWPELVREWSRAVVEGGAVVLVDRGSRPELSRRALCGGLMDLEQRAAGRTGVTSGLVAKIPGYKGATGGRSTARLPPRYRGGIVDRAHCAGNFSALRRGAPAPAPQDTE
jgi:hypothetical protein